MNSAGRLDTDWAALIDSCSGGARQIIDARGLSAGFELGRLAWAPSLNPIQRARLLAIADEIEARQGYGWFFDDDEAGAAAP